jgi:BirA family biotin operon repressor/biotin-[acetyl-CoA-carboxylase] ligase
LEIIYLKDTTSTHKVLIAGLESGKFKPPFAISADIQTDGVGSKNNSWIGEEGNLFLSFCVDINSLPSDLPKQSMSIYFSYLLKEVLAEFGSKLFLKWPNDFYLGDKKIGGTITKILKDKFVVCSIGLNLKNAPEEFEIIDIEVDKISLIESYFLKLKQDIFWKNIFSKYQVEFSKSQRFSYYDEVLKEKVFLKDAKLQKDGAIVLNKREVYSLR